MTAGTAPSPWERYWHGPVAAVRPYLLIRSVLFVLSFDLWAQMLPHGARYGTGGFNVAHFDWLDAVQPAPGAALYVGVTIVTGLSAFVGAVTGERAAIAAAAIAYTYGWSMSLLDAFQHHYLLSLLLLGFALTPRFTARDAGRAVHAWAYRLLTATLGLVYLFASASKFDARWQGGSAMAAIAAGKWPFATVEGLAATAGISSGSFWTIAALGVTALEIVIAAGYLLSPVREASASVLLRRLGWATLACAAVLHGGIEVLRLAIGWFSAYMLLAVGAVFLPEAWLVRAAEILSLPAREASEAYGARLSRPLAAVASALAAVAAWVWAGWVIDLPGAPSAGVVAAAAIAAFAVAAIARGRTKRGAVVAIAACAAAVECVVVIAVTPVRVDFYRHLGFDLGRRGDVAGALAAYERARARASPAEAREHELDAKIEELRRKLVHPDP